MTTSVFLIVLAAALLHASWNAIIKTGGDKLTGLLMVALGDGLVGIAVAMARPVPGMEVWPWILASGIIRTVYMLFLGYAYVHGDLSRVYPIARGAAPLFVLLVSGLLLSDQISTKEFAGIIVLGGGILLMAQGALANGESRRLLPLAVGSAMATAGYSIVDGTGARLAGDAIAFVSWALAVTAMFYLPVVIALRGRSVLPADKRAWGFGVVAGSVSYLAYAIVVWAMTQAPIVLVAALRETSILFAVLIGWLVFGEKMHKSKLIAAGLIVFGVAITRL